MNQNCTPTIEGHRDLPFRVIPVIDLRNGQAVHAVGGRRTHYQPLRSIFHPSSEPISLAQALRSALGLDTLYVADLDAIEGCTPCVDIFREIISLGFHLWIDAGVHDRASMAPLLGLEHSSCTLVAGLETLEGPGALTDIIRQVGPGRVISSLDLFEGRPRIPARAGWKTEDPLELAQVAIECGVNQLLVLDLARVGTNRGPVTSSLIDQLRAGCPRALLSVGGGISRIDEIAKLRDAGANAVLVGSAIHDGRVGTPELLQLDAGCDSGSIR